MQQVTEYIPPGKRGALGTRTVTVAQSRRDLQFGIVKAAQLVRTMGDWSVMLTYKIPHNFKGETVEGMDCIWLADARGTGVRRFKALDAAVRTLEQIGLKVDCLQVVS